jgi:hypothetical protein
MGDQSYDARIDAFRRVWVYERPVYQRAAEVLEIAVQARLGQTTSSDEDLVRRTARAIADAKCALAETRAALEVMFDRFVGIRRGKLPSDGAVAQPFGEALGDHPRL